MVTSVEVTYPNVGYGVGGNVIDFEGTGDDFTDNTAAFNAAVSQLQSVVAATNSPGILRIPRGIFRISRPIKITQSNITIEGVGRYATQIRQMTIVGNKSLYIGGVEQQGFPCIEIRGTPKLNGKTWTDLVVGGQIIYGGTAAVALKNQTIVTSAAQPFTNADEGTVLQITGGTGWNLGFYDVSHVDQYGNAFLNAYASGAVANLVSATGGQGAQYSGKLVGVNVRSLGFLNGFTVISLGQSTGVDGRPCRDYVAGVYVTSASRCVIEDIMVDGMVTGVKLRGNALQNSVTGNTLLDYDNVVRDCHFTNVDFGILLEQQARGLLTKIRAVGVNATQYGGTGGWEPPHTIYTTGPLNSPWSRSYNMNISDCSTFGNTYQSAYKFKYLTGSTVSNLVADYCERAADIEGCFNCTFTNMVGRNPAPSTPYVVQQTAVGTTGTLDGAGNLTDPSNPFRSGDGGANDIWIFPAGTVNNGGQLTVPAGKTASKFNTTAATYPAINLTGNTTTQSGTVIWALVAADVVSPDSQYGQFNVANCDECIFNGLLADVTGADTCPGFVIRTADFGVRAADPVFTVPSIVGGGATGALALGPVAWTSNGQGYRSNPAVTIIDNITTGTPGSGATAILLGRLLSDLATAGNDSVIATSASQPFTLNDIGNSFTLTSGTNFKAGTYRIMSVDGSGNATLSTSPSTAGTTLTAGVAQLQGWDAITQQVYGIVITNGGTGYSIPTITVGGSCNDNLFADCNVSACYTTANSKQGFRMSGANRNTFAGCKFNNKSGGDASLNSFSFGTAGGNTDYRSGGFGPNVLSDQNCLLNPLITSLGSPPRLANISAGVTNTKILLNRDLIIGQDASNTTGSLIGDSGTNTAVQQTGAGNPPAIQNIAVTITDAKLVTTTTLQSLTLNVTNLATDAAVSGRVSSGSRNFTTADIGMALNVTAGTGWTKGVYYVRSITGTAANLDRAPAGLNIASGTADLAQRPFGPSDVGFAVTLSGNSAGVIAGTYQITAVATTLIATLDRVAGTAGTTGLTSTLGNSATALPEFNILKMGNTTTPSVRDQRGIYRPGSANIKSLNNGVKGQTVTLYIPPTDTTSSVLGAGGTAITDLINGPNNSGASPGTPFTATQVGAPINITAGTGFTPGQRLEVLNVNTYNQNSYTDLATDGTGLVVTSAGIPFTTAAVGRLLPVTAGTGWTPGVYQIVSVSGSNATIDRSAGASATAGVANSPSAVATFNASLGTLGTTLNNSGTFNFINIVLANDSLTASTAPLTWGPFTNTTSGHTLTLMCINSAIPVWVEVSRS